MTKRTERQPRKDRSAGLPASKSARSLILQWPREMVVEAADRLLVRVAPLELHALFWAAAGFSKQTTLLLQL
jgi:hypothetical protein